MILRLKNATFYNRVASLPAPDADGWIPFVSLQEVGLREADFIQRRIPLERRQIQTKHRIIKKRKEILPLEKVGYLLHDLIDYLHEDDGWDYLSEATKDVLFDKTFKEISYENGRFVLYHETVIQEDEFEVQVRFNRYP